MERRKYESIEAKKAAVEAVLRGFEAEEKVSSLVGWRYTRQAWNALPSWLRSCVFRNSISPKCRGLSRQWDADYLPKPYRL